MVDFLHAFRKYSLKMLEGAGRRKIFGEDLTVKVLMPEDIIGLKVQSLVNDPLRAMREYADIEAILSFYKGKINWETLEEYFSLFNLDGKFKELKERAENVE